MIQYLTVVKPSKTYYEEILTVFFVIERNKKSLPHTETFSALLFVQNDLLTLKVTSQLHHLSIKCAIHVLHANKFNPNCLRRRPGEEVSDSVLCCILVSFVILLQWLTCGGTFYFNG